MISLIAIAFVFQFLKPACVAYPILTLDVFPLQEEVLECVSEVDCQICCAQLRKIIHRINICSSLI